MNRSLALILIPMAFAVGCTSTSPVAETSPQVETAGAPMPVTRPVRRDSLRDLGGGRARLTPAAAIGDERIGECSGIVYAGGSWWTHNDSGDGPYLFRSSSPWFLEATRHEVEGAVNVDWEELAVLGGDVLACDIGDNARTRDDLTIYRVRPTPDGVETVAIYPVAYPDGAHDAEAVWVWDGRVHIVIKNRGEDASWVYRFGDLKDRSELADGERNVPEKIGSVNLPKGEQVTAADSSADGLVVLLTYSQALFFVADDVSGDPIASFNLNARQCEAVAWTASGIVFANEQRDVYMVEDPIGCDLKWWLPPRASVVLSRLPPADMPPGSWEREALGELPVGNLRDGESVRMGISGNTIIIDAELLLEADLVVSEGRLGTAAIVGFAAEPGLMAGDQDRLFAVIVPADQPPEGVPFSVVPFSMLGPPANQDLTGVSVSGAGNEKIFSFRLEIAISAVFPDGLPDRFLFQFVCNGCRAGDDEPRLSALDLYSLMRPFTWADVTVQ